MPLHGGQVSSWPAKPTPSDDRENAGFAGMDGRRPSPDDPHNIRRIEPTAGRRAGLIHGFIITGLSADAAGCARGDRRPGLILVRRHALSHRPS